MTAFFGAVFIFIGLLDCIVLALIKLVNDTNKLAQAVKRLIETLHDLWKKKIEQIKSRLITFGGVDSDF